MFPTFLGGVRTLDIRVDGPARARDVKVTDRIQASIEQIDSLVAAACSVTEPEDVAQLSRMIRHESTRKAIADHPFYLTDKVERLRVDRHAELLAHFLPAIYEKTMALKPPAKMKPEHKEKLEVARWERKGDKAWILELLLRVLRDAPVGDLRRAGGATDACCQCAAKSLRERNRGGEVFPLILRCAREVHPADSATLWPLQCTAVRESVGRSHFKLAASFAEHPKLDIDPKRTGLTPLEFLEFHYFGGTALAGLERWEEAVELFQRCMELPGRGLSKLVVGAHAKWMLGSIIATGSVPTLPSDLMSKPVSYNLEKANQAYYQFAAAYRSAAGAGAGATAIARKAREATLVDPESAEGGKGGAEGGKGAGAGAGAGASAGGSGADSASGTGRSGGGGGPRGGRGGHGSMPLDEVVRRNLDEFREDGTLGMVKLAISQLERTSIRKLTRTYLRLDLSDIAARTGLESPQAAERVILDMCAKRSIFARVDRATGTVNFDAPMPTFDDPASLAALQKKIVAAADMAERVSEAEARVASSRGFLASRHGKKALRGEGGGASGGYVLDSADAVAPSGAGSAEQADIDLALARSMQHQ